MEVTFPSCEFTQYSRLIKHLLLADVRASHCRSSLSLSDFNGPAWFQVMVQVQEPTQEEQTCDYISSTDQMKSVKHLWLSANNESHTCHKTAKVGENKRLGKYKMP